MPSNHIFFFQTNHIFYLWGYYTIPRVFVGLELNHLATRGEMVQFEFHALDNHVPFMRLLCLNAGYLR
jgi:hypothetical protein